MLILPFFLLYFFHYFLTRSDDKTNVVKYRLKLYEKDIKKIRDYYSAKGVFTTIDNTEFNINEIINYLE